MPLEKRTGMLNRKHDNRHKFNTQYFSVDPASWLKPKFQKKALTSLWGSLEGSFTKFVSGDEVITQEPTPPRKSTEIMSRPF